MRPLAAVIFAGMLCCACTQEDRGCVSAATPDAARAGWAILKAGGNAADAAVAAAFTLAATEPAGSGLGGQSVVILMKPGEPAVVLDGSSFAPHGIPDTLAPDTPLTGRRAATVPTTVKTLFALWRDHGSGSIRWEQCLAPAIEAAEKGFRPRAFGAAASAMTREELASDSVAAGVFLDHELVRQPQLASTLREIADNPSSFYTGRIAREIARDMRAHDGWISLEDLKRVNSPRIRTPLHLRYRDRDVYTLPPPYGGWVVLEALQMLVRTEDERTLRNDHLLRALYRAHRARKLHPMMTLPDDAVQKHFSDPVSARSSNDEETGGETTHLSAVDAGGMVVGISQSVNYYYGCKVMHPTLGFFYNDYMREYEREDPNHPFALRPGALPYSSMSATIVARDGRPELMLGSPGSARIISAVVQVLHRLYDAGMPLGRAVAMPRFHVKPDGSVYLEAGSDRRNFRNDTSVSFRFDEPPRDIMIAGKNPWFGGVHAVMCVDGHWIGAADPRRDGAVAPECSWVR